MNSAPHAAPAHQTGTRRNARPRHGPMSPLPSPRAHRRTAHEPGTGRTLLTPHRSARPSPGGTHDTGAATSPRRPGPRRCRRRRRWRRPGGPRRPLAGRNLGGPATPRGRAPCMRAASARPARYAPPALDAAVEPRPRGVRRSRMDAPTSRSEGYSDHEGYNGITLSPMSERTPCHAGTSRVAHGGLRRPGGLDARSRSGSAPGDRNE